MDYVVIAMKIKQKAVLGCVFVDAAMSIAGLPPFSGFLGKLVVLQSAAASEQIVWVWSVILVSSLITIIALSRAGTTLFWRSTHSHDVAESAGVSQWQLWGTLLLLGASPLLALFGASFIEYTNNAAAQLHDIQSLIKVMKLEGGV